MVTRDNSEAVKEKLVRAMKIARQAWTEAEMPQIRSDPGDGKIALALLAIHVYGQLE